MVDPKGLQASRSQTVAVTLEKLTRQASDDGKHRLVRQDRIRERAYELYESRGREPGQDEQDWLRAEKGVSNRSNKKVTTIHSHPRESEPRLEG